MKVSVIVINYNTFQLTGNCIRSVYSKTKGVDFEIIVVDNASSECDAEKFKEEFPDIILLKNKENLGFAKGNNVGIALAKGDVILLLNSDTELVEDSVAICYNKLQELHDSVGVISCRLVFPNGNIQRQCNRFPSISLNVMELFRVQKLMRAGKRANKFLGAYFDNTSDVFPDWFWGTFFMFRREDLIKLKNGKLNEDSFMYYEDVRWCYDFSLIGKKCFYYSKTKVIHLLSQSVTNKSAKENVIIHNEMSFIVKVQGKIYMVIYGLTRALNCMFSSFKVGGNVKRGMLYLKAIANEGKQKMILLNE